MTKRERFLAFAGFEPVDRVPRRASYVEGLRRTMTDFLKQDPMSCFDMDCGVSAGLRPPDGYTPPDFSAYHPGYQEGKDGFRIDGNGVGHLNHGFHHFTEYISPLRDAERFEELESYPFIDRSGWSDSAIVEAAERARAQGDFANMFVGHIYENAWQVRGYEEFLVDLVTRRDWAEYILDRFKHSAMLHAVAAARAGFDLISAGDDVANQQALMFQPQLWREVMKPRWAEVFAAARAIKPDIHIWYHSDGNIEVIIDELVEIGVTILNPVQPECMDPFAIRKRFGSRLAFDGCVGTQTTFPFGTPEDMRRVVRELGEGLSARQGGLMLSPTHVLEPEVPPANVVAFFEACDAL